MGTKYHSAHISPLHVAGFTVPLSLMLCTLPVWKSLTLPFTRLNFKLKGGTDYPDIRLLGHPDIRIVEPDIRCSPNTNVNNQPHAKAISNKKQWCCNSQFTAVHWNHPGPHLKGLSRSGDSKTTILVFSNWSQSAETLRQGNSPIPNFHKRLLRNIIIHNWRGRSLGTRLSNWTASAPKLQACPPVLWPAVKRAEKNRLLYKVRRADGEWRWEQLMVC